MPSIGTMIEQLEGLRDTDALTDWENEFVTSVVIRYWTAHKNTTALSAKQVEKIENIWRKHFA